MSDHLNQSMTLDNKLVHIMGLGWLGIPLARSLMQYGANVSGTVTTLQKQSMLSEASFDTDIFNLYQAINQQSSNSNKAISSRFEHSNLIINIPPGRKNFERKTFVVAMLNLIDYAMDAGLQKVIFISTTSVFGGHSGVVTNKSKVLPTTQSGAAHAEIEEYLLVHYKNRSNIIRPAGLVGPNSIGSNTHKTRHPIYSLCQKSNIPKGNDPVNLVHQADLIQAIVSLLTRKVEAHSFNLSAIEHPTRQDYYQWCAKKLSLPMPTFANDTKKRQLGKLIDAQDTFSSLHIKPIFASPFDML
jgi:nucleoside-diphosphate-sugar epimerase